MTTEIFPQPNTICKVLAGSRAYGTNHEGSDWDYRGIFVGSPIQIRTPFFPIKEQSDSTEEDTKYYELCQFMKLAIDCNPNILEILHVGEQAVLFSTPSYEILREAAPRLLNRKVAFTTTGYAMSQLARIKGHNKWINNPMPEQQPRQSEFISLVTNFTPDKFFSFEDVRQKVLTGHVFASYGSQEQALLLGIYPGKPEDRLFDRNGAILVADDLDKATNRPLMIVKFNKDEYNVHKDKWSNYWTWKKNRNAARSELEEKHGFDTKHAMHLVRLLRMGKEALTEGIINVHRSDAAELLDIRNGKWTYEEILEYANELNEEVKRLADTSYLPKTPDIKFAAQLIIQIQDSAWTTK